MDADRLIPGIIGAIVGVVGWLIVGIYMQRRQFARQAKSAGRAVYFELLLNRMHVVVARDYATFLPLSRSAFERLLPELATWLPAATLQLVVGAYMGHAGYAQASTKSEAPPGLQRRAFAAIEVAHRAALDALRPQLFTTREQAAIANLDGGHASNVATTEVSSGHSEVVRR
jgi:hypothetical protein